MTRTRPRSSGRSTRCGGRSGRRGEGAVRPAHRRRAPRPPRRGHALLAGPAVDARRGLQPPTLRARRGRPARHPGHPVRRRAPRLRRRARDGVPGGHGRGATWDVDLEEAIGEAIGREVRAQGGNFFGGVCINLPRHPAWGRVQETYGDDPLHLGELGAALTRGTERYVMACVKHYALNSMENARFTVDVRWTRRRSTTSTSRTSSERIDEGVSAVMASYNSVNGEWAGQNRVPAHRRAPRPVGLGRHHRHRFRLGHARRCRRARGRHGPRGALRAAAGHPPARRSSRPGRRRGTRCERSGVRILATQLRSYAGRAAADPGDRTSWPATRTVPSPARRPPDRWCC